MSSPREPRPDEAAGPDDRPGVRGPEESPATDAGATAAPAVEPSGRTSPEGERSQAEPSEGERSASAPAGVSLTGRPIDDGPVIGQLRPGGAPSTPPERAPLAPASTDSGTGQHAAARPYPPAVPVRDVGRDAAGMPAGGDRPGEPAPAATTAPAPAAAAPSASSTGEPTTAPATPVTTGPAAGSAPATAVPVAGAASRRELREREETDRETHEDLPERPRKPGVGRHLLGALLGLVLTPVALLLVGIGTSRLSDVAGSGDPASDALGLTLLVVGAVLLAVIALLGAWTPLVPITGGLLWGLGLGIAYLVVPELMQDTVDAVVQDRVLPAVVEQVTESAMSGLLVVVGALLLASGVASARARRAGRRWAEGVAVAEAARLEASRADAARAEARAAGQRPTA